MFFVLANTWGVTKVVSCVDESTPAMVGRVDTTRHGHIAERHLLGCTFYYYETP